ncbi:MAG TPA: hypothetical protein VKB53_06740, partial [Gammaproteobacteria bacterium]|nr:hypothetical protein [Gammaproteobacteria bacterium]
MRCRVPKTEQRGGSHRNYGSHWETLRSSARHLGFGSAVLETVNERGGDGLCINSGRKLCEESTHTSLDYWIGLIFRQGHTGSKQKRANFFAH